LSKVGAKMNIKKFLDDDQGVMATEYVIFVAAVGIIMAVGATALFNGMKSVFGAWASYFGGGS
jgi:Flp pilus assembly pilin Flp